MKKNTKCKDPVAVQSRNDAETMEKEGDIS
jgi:hypothetical protein